MNVIETCQNTVSRLLFIVTSYWQITKRCNLYFAEELHLPLTLLFHHGQASVRTCTTTFQNVHTGIPFCCISCGFVPGNLTNIVQDQCCIYGTMMTSRNWTPATPSVVFTSNFGCNFVRRSVTFRTMIWNFLLYPAHKTIPKSIIQCKIWQRHNVILLTVLYVPMWCYLSWRCRRPQETYGTLSFIWAGKTNNRIYFVTRGLSVILLQQLQFPII